jgi:hypothetical protein
MTQRISLGFDFRALMGATMCGLDFTCPPARPQQSRGFGSCEPSIARRSLIWQDHANKATVQPLFAVMTDGGTQVFEIAARPAWIAAVIGVASARRARYVRESHSAPKIVQSSNPRVEPLLIGMSVGAVIDVDGKNVRHVDHFKIALATFWVVLLRDIGS